MTASLLSFMVLGWLLCMALVYTLGGTGADEGSMIVSQHQRPPSAGEEVTNHELHEDLCKPLG